MILELFDQAFQKNAGFNEMTGENIFKIAERIFDSPESIVFLNDQLPQAKRNQILNDLTAFNVTTKIIKQPSLLIPTSGTSSMKLKIVVTEKIRFLNAAQRANDYLDSSKSDKWLVSLPLHHVAGLSILARAYLNKNDVYYLPKWHPEEFVRKLDHWGITFCSLVPTQIYDIVKLNLEAPAQIKCVLVGGSTLSEALSERMAILGWPLLKTFGMSETSAFMSVSDENNFYEPLPDVNISLDQNRHLSIRCDSLFEGYLQQTDASWHYTPRVLENGFWSTEDRAALTTRPGKPLMFELLGRETGMIKIKGELVNVNLLNNRLSELATEHGLPPQSLVLHFLPDLRDENELFVIFSETETDETQKKIIDLFNSSVLPFERISWYVKVPEIAKSDLGKVKLGVFNTAQFKETYFENRKNILE